MQLALGTEPRRNAFAVDEGWSMAVSHPRSRNVPVHLVVQHTLWEILYKVSNLAKAKSVLSRLGERVEEFEG